MIAKGNLPRWSAFDVKELAVIHDALRTLARQAPGETNAATRLADEAWALHCQRTSEPRALSRTDLGHRAVKVCDDEGRVLASGFVSGLDTQAGTVRVHVAHDDLAFVERV